MIEVAMQDMAKTAFALQYPEGVNATAKFLVSRNYCYSMQDAAEVAQAAWAKGYFYLHQAKNDTTLVNWVNSIAKNIARNRFRRLKGKKFTSLDALTIDPVHELESTITSRKLLSLRVLSPKERELMILTYVHGLCTEEIVELFPQMNKTTVRVSLHRARLKIRQYIKKSSARPR